MSQQLWLLLLQLQAADSTPALAAQAAAASDGLAGACALTTPADLAAMHAPALMNTVTQVNTLAWWQTRDNAVDHIMPGDKRHQSATLHQPLTSVQCNYVNVVLCLGPAKGCAYLSLLLLHIHLLGSYCLFCF